MTKNKVLPPPLATVVIPSYNYANRVTRAIQSVKDQTLSNLECFIIDDGSTDNTKDIVLRAIKDDLRFHYIYQHNAGVANARNKGVFSGTGKYVCCLDADDAIAPTYLEVCVTFLEKSPLYYMAYTGLYFIKPDGEEGLSDWPGEYNFDLQLKGYNQVPTCNVSRRSVWERLGGQRQRYAPFGAGEEDAEMWLRAGAHGMPAKKVTNEGLFIYSFMSGKVSGGKEHKSVDWLRWHPWVYDNKHPFASAATPKDGYASHSVWQYDIPTISVVIPVGLSHLDKLYDALDSIEAQTFRKWEVVAVLDFVEDENLSQEDAKSVQIIKQSYPFVRFFHTNGHNGAGFARNLGAKHSKAPYILFLDADDWLVPQALEMMLIEAQNNDAIVYCDYFGQSFVDSTTIAEFKDRLLFYNEKNGEALIRYFSADYNCLRAVNQPGEDMYIWCLVSCLVKREWHDSIGGFDEHMQSWEDWDYWIRMAKSGKCFTHIHEPLVGYRFYTGGRREVGFKHYENLIEYLRNKYERLEIMACRTCGQSKVALPERNIQNAPAQGPAQADMVFVEYNSQNRGQHMVVGMATGKRYGYHAGSERFFIHKKDYAVATNFFTMIETTPAIVSPIPEQQPVIQAPKQLSITESNPQATQRIPDAIRGVAEVPFDLQTIAGITNSIAIQLHAYSVYNAQDLLQFGVGRLQQECKGVGPKRAEAIIASARKLVNG